MLSAPRLDALCLSAPCLDTLFLSVCVLCGSLRERALCMSVSMSVSMCELCWCLSVCSVGVSMCELCRCLCLCSMGICVCEL